VTTAASTFNQIKAQVAAIRQKIPHARVVGIRAPGRWTGERRKEDSGETYLIEQCDSPLAMRIALREKEDDATKVLITSLDDREVGDDVLVRLVKRRLFPIDSWQIVKSLFKVHSIDPRITRHGWIAEYLMELCPREGYPAAIGGFLDAETVWPILLGRGMGLAGERPDLQALLKWSIERDNVRQFQRALEPFRQGAAEWLTGVAGPTASLVLDCVRANELPDALPIGLAASVVFHPKAAGKLEKAAGKLEERYLGGKSPDSGAIGRWSVAATEVVRLQLTDPKSKRQQLGRADEILGEVGAESFAHLSDTSPLGFDQRLAAFGGKLAGTLSRGGPRAVAALSKARTAILRHDLAGRERRRLERVDMAVRLVRWFAAIQSKPVEAESLAESAAYQLAEGGFVDWARLALRSGDPVRELSEAYGRLFDQVTELREKQAHRFATLLKDWTAAGSTGDDVIPVESILERIVGPLAAEAPVLVIVIDGMSVAVYRELLADITRHEWVALAEEGRGSTRPGLATIPSVTEASRTSLFCGRLLSGGANQEKAGFAELPALVAQSRGNSPPVLFHKPALQETDDASLAGDVRKEIGSSHRRIVGVVVNAVDDHLLKGEQIDIRWSRDEIKVLPALLHEARIARRIVVLLSDHGHVLDCGTEGRPHEGGERWRSDEGDPEADELRISGGRVVTPESKTLIAPWSERIRYGVKKNGYHGGLAPQEIVVPIAVLCANETYPAGWVEAAVETPAWWDEPLRELPSRQEEPPKLKPIRPKKPGFLFDLEAEEPAQQPVEVAPVAEVPEWITALLASPIFDEQKKLGGRTVPANEVFSRLLAAVDSRGGKMTSVTLARAINYPPIRLRGLLAVAQRVLNIDGYAVLTRDEASDTVELNRDLLCRQFDLV
jgi:hypothetical protein